MAQHDYSIANGGGAAVRADINNALAAVQSMNSGSSAPTSTVAGMMWYDTLNGALKVRNSANTAWIAAAELIAGGGQLAGMRNKIMNGKMDIAQRGTSFAAANGYTLDRWRLVQFVSPAVGTITQQADVPSSNEFQSSLRYAVTTADSSIGATERAFISQPIEGFNVRDLIGRTFTISFWVRSSKTGIHCLSLKNNTYDRTFIVEYTINAANTWEFKTITVAGGLITAGSWNWTNGFGLDVCFALASGSTFNTTAGAWQTGDFVATSAQVNCLDTVGNIFAITGVQLEVGSVATPFEHRPIGAELALCQRYYEVLGGVGFTMYCDAVARTLSNFYSYKVSKRATPSINGTVTYSNANTGVFGNITTDSFSLSCTAGGVAGQVSITSSGTTAAIEL